MHGMNLIGFFYTGFEFGRAFLGSRLEVKEVF